jgi:hypothetical protein
MKNLKNIRTIIVVVTIGLSTIFSKAENSILPEARKAFKYLMHTAHPLPVEVTDKEILPGILAERDNSPIFLNYDMIDSESGEQYRMQNESSIAVNPKNPKMLIGSAVDYRAESSTWVYFSENGGKEWYNFNLGKPFADWRSSNDPSVAYDTDGYAYLVYGGFGMRNDTSYGESFGENGVFISVSTDGGRTWDSNNTHIPVILHRGVMTIDSLFEDKYYISIDHSAESPYLNHLYIPWKRVTPRDSATQIVISKSTDKGKTWSLPLPVSERKSGTSQDTTYGQSFPLAATGPGGEVYLVWNDGIVHGVGFAKSYDGGVTFSNPEIIHNYNIFGVATDHSGAYDEEPIWRHTLKGVVRAEAYPVLVVDTTEYENRGALYLTWAADNPPNIYFSKSSDEGNSWSEPVIIHSDSSNDQFWQWMAVDPMNGDIAVMYLDSRDDPENLRVECYVSYSRDGGINWTDRKISDFGGDLRRNPFAQHFAGDYSGMAFYNGIVYPSWIDMRSAVHNIFDSDVYTSFVNVWAPAPVENFDASSIAEKFDEISLSWERPNGYIFDQPMENEKFHYLLYLEDDTVSLPSEQQSYVHKNLTIHRKYHYKMYVIAGRDTSICKSDSAYAGGAKELAAAQILNGKGSGTNEIELTVKLPEYRADMQTELINLSKLNLYSINDELLSSLGLAAEDAGKEIKMNYNPGERGFYEFYVKAFDDEEPANESIKSNEIEIYTGKVENSYSDDFNNGLKKYGIKNTWNITSSFSYSQPNSLTDSPEGEYVNLEDNYCDIFPVQLNEGEEIVVEFRHAAIVYKNDTAQILYSFDGRESWEILGEFNSEDYTFWRDGVLDANDWKYEKFILSCKQSDTVFVRFKISTRIFGADDGWYIDDLNIYSKPISVKEKPEESRIIIYPNPVSDILNIYVDNLLSTDISNLSIYNALGTELNILPKSVSGNIIQYDISALAQGLYYIKSFHRKEIEILKFLKVK